MLNKKQKGVAYFISTSRELLDKFMVLKAFLLNFICALIFCMVYVPYFAELKLSLLAYLFSLAVLLCLFITFFLMGVVLLNFSLFMKSF